MKKLLLSFSALVILGLPKVSAQTPNPGFETWTTNLIDASVKDPNTGLNSDGWWEFNLLNSPLLGGTPVTVFQDSYNPEQGSYCAKIISEPMTQKAYDTLHYYGFNYLDTNGLLFTAYIGYNGSFDIKSGIPINQGRISSYSFYYRYYPNGIDTASCTIEVFHWGNGVRNLIGGGLWTVNSTTSNWTMVSVPIIYFPDSVTVPDTAVIVYSACSLYKNPKAYDSLMIDNASITGIDDINTPHDNVNLYPNPATDAINLIVSGQFEASRVEVYDITGKLIGTYGMNNNSLTINTQSFVNGTYLYKLLDNTGVQLNIGKFSVIR
jgi:hypothetical protein